MKTDLPHPDAKTLPPVVPEAGRPLYLTATRAIRQAIDGGAYVPGERIPSTEQVSRMLNVSLVTAHRALKELVAGGVLMRSQGRGTFVADGRAASGTGPATAARIGLVLHRGSSLADFYHGRMFEGVRQAALDAHADLVLLRYGEDTRRECDGLLIVNPLAGELEGLVSRGRPCVVVGTTRRADLDDKLGAARRRVAFVDTDNVDLARRAVAHLQSLGHTRIGFVGGNDAVSNSADRWQGFREATDAGPGRQVPVVRTPGWQLDEASGAKLRQLLTSADRPTAVFAAGYYFALDVYAACADVGLTVGRDVGVIGVDDPPSARHLSPPLATVLQPLQRLGRAALETLLGVLSGRPAADKTLRADVVERESAGGA